MARLARFPAVLLIASMTAGCTATPSTSISAVETPLPSATLETTLPTPTASVRISEGDPMPPIERPDAVTCDRLQRHDRLAAKNARASVSFSRMLDASDEAIEAAETDASANIDVLGIPLRPDELHLVRNSGGHLDEGSPIALWAHVSRTDLFGGIWIDPPGSDRFVVSIVDGNRQAHDLARCLERANLDVRYVMASYSLQELNELHERFIAETKWLEADGFNIVSSGADELANRLNVEIEGLTDEVARQLMDTYGDALAIDILPVPTPYVPLDRAHVPFAMGTDVLFDEARNDGRQDERGRWELVRGRLSDGALRLHVVMEPPDHGLPVRSGPAVLFAGMQGYGGSGDMGIGRPIDALAIVALPSCDDDACRYETDVVLPAEEIMPAVRWLEEHGEVMWITASMTLVRTFGDGTWLQVLPFLEADDRNGSSGQGAGRLGEIEPVGGTLFPFGLFPAAEASPIPGDGSWMFTTGFDYARVVERERRKLVDPSRPLDMVEATLRTAIDPSCEHAAHLTVHDDAGDRVFDADVHRKESLDASFTIPTGTIWRLTLHDGGGIDYDQGRQGSGIRVGEIRSDGEAVAIAATFDCAALSGSVEVAPAR